MIECLQVNFPSKYGFFLKKYSIFAAALIAMGV